MAVAHAFVDLGAGAVALANDLRAGQRRADSWQPPSPLVLLFCSFPRTPLRGHAAHAPTSQRAPPPPPPWRFTTPFLFLSPLVYMFWFVCSVLLLCLDHTLHHSTSLLFCEDRQGRCTWCVTHTHTHKLLTAPPCEQVRRPSRCALMALSVTSPSLSPLFRFSSCSSRGSTRAGGGLQRSRDLPSGIDVPVLLSVASARTRLRSAPPSPPAFHRSLHGLLLFVCLQGMGQRCAPLSSTFAHPPPSIFCSFSCALPLMHVPSFSLPSHACGSALMCACEYVCG